LSARTLTTPPAYKSQVPLRISREPKSIRELYLQTFEFLDLEQAVTSLNGYCWSQVISQIREEDQKLQDISHSSVGHIEDIKKTFSVVQRGGTLGWRSVDTPVTTKLKMYLEEDFRHLLDQADFLWETRAKWASIRQQEARAREKALTNSFTYLYCPFSTPELSRILIFCQFRAHLAHQLDFWNERLANHCRQLEPKHMAVLRWNSCAQLFHRLRLGHLELASYQEEAQQDAWVYGVFGLCGRKVTRHISSDTSTTILRNGMG
jgi:hypothetical protein